MEDRGARMEDRGARMEDRGARIEKRGQRKRGGWRRRGMEESARAHALAGGGPIEAPNFGNPDKGLLVSVSFHGPARALAWWGDSLKRV